MLVVFNRQYVHCRLTFVLHLIEIHDWFTSTLAWRRLSRRGRTRSMQIQWIGIKWKIISTHSLICRWYKNGRPKRSIFKWFFMKYIFLTTEWFRILFALFSLKLRLSLSLSVRLFVDRLRPISIAALNVIISIFLLFLYFVNNIFLWLFFIIWRFLTHSAHKH